MSLPSHLFAGTLVAVTGLDPNVIKRIGRVAEDMGATVAVETDADIEGDAAIEHDFDTPEQTRLVVPRERLRLIVDDPNPPRRTS